MKIQDAQKFDFNVKPLKVYFMQYMVHMYT